jgi:hypothetical protein
MPASSNSRWSELPVPLSRCQSSGTPASSAAASSSASMRRRGALTGDRSRKEAPRPTSSSESA